MIAARTQAMQAGIVGYSGKQGDTCNDSCHEEGFGTPPLVHFEGPMILPTGALATFRFVVQSQSSKQSVAGFNVASSDGVLDILANQDERVEADELTHEAPKPDVNARATWDFTWTAPPQPGSYTLYGAGLSANGNGTRSGDDSATATFLIAVTAGPPGDANCDGRPTAADVTAVLTRLPSGVPQACHLADANGDGVIDGRDQALTIAALFELQP